MFYEFFFVTLHIGMDFSEIIGQKDMAARLMSLADQQRLPHAMMLCGKDGVGKMALALSLATYVLNKGNMQVRNNMHPDLHYTFPTIKLKKWTSEYKPISDDFIEQWRTMINRSPYFTLQEWTEMMGTEKQQAIITAGEAADLFKKLMIKSSAGGWKVSIIWLPERMNQECANKLLKLIEEPPGETLFIMVCREPERLLDTIRSRVQRFDVPPIATADMEQALISRRALSPDDAQRVARLAAGSWTAATAELDASSENVQFFDLYVMLMRKAYARSVKDLKRWAENVALMGREEQRRLLMYFLRMTREAFVYNFHMQRLTYMTSAEEQFCQRFARFVNEGNVLGFQDLFQKAYNDIGQNANAKMVFFDITMQIAVLLHNTQNIPKAQ